MGKSGAYGYILVNIFNLGEDLFGSYPNFEKFRDILDAADDNILDGWYSDLGVGL